ncbi:hypothetical protein [Methylocapsa palsarum]|uniref:Uncharacterized protein n=1 Tax=Methylocapsa palsarum TaxID=1612308 RepID=A0A1I4CBG3_9HYPH|nr:hypothetical protein [Methylocapsa palsarum]SFK78514.1 hypothetical protein SAMN05444581_12034 [Methylocapsa palsarum]
METVLERIRAKITDLEAKIADLRITEREIETLEKPASAAKRKPRTTKPAPVVKQKRKASAKAAGEPRQTIGTAVTDVLGKHGASQVAEIAEHIQAAGRAIDRRAISFTLQALKKRGLVKSAEGKWLLAKARASRAE